MDVVIVGGGFGGLLMGARRREAGFGRLRLIEKAGDVRGTWYWNRYPGAMCDVESYVYLPPLGNPNGFFAGTYGAGPVKVLEILDRWRADGSLEGVDIR